MVSIFFFFNDTATTEIYTLSLHDALPICKLRVVAVIRSCIGFAPPVPPHSTHTAVSRGEGTRSNRRVRWHTNSLDRKSTRLNSSHTVISYAVFCLEKNKNR